MGIVLVLIEITMGPISTYCWFVDSIGGMLYHISQHTLETIQWTRFNGLLHSCIHFWYLMWKPLELFYSNDFIGNGDILCILNTMQTSNKRNNSFIQTESVTVSCHITYCNNNILAIFWQVTKLPTLLLLYYFYTMAKNKLELKIKWLTF